MEKKVLAFDFGASGGRAMCGTFDGDKISIEELHRFSNDPVILNGSMYWDVLRLFFEIKQGLIKAKKCGKIESIGIDTWGVDFGLIDEEGRLLENPVHYRDARTEGMIEESFKLIDKEKFYQITGNQFMDLNTAFQLLSLVKTRKELLEKADKMILMPDLFNYFLTGEKKAEYSIASTTQLLDAKKGEVVRRSDRSTGNSETYFPGNSYLQVQRSALLQMKSVQSLVWIRLMLWLLRDMIRRAHLYLYQHQKKILSS